MQGEQHSELAIPEVQRRLQVLGYQLGDEAKRGLYGEQTAAALASFKDSMGLGFDDTLDQATWATLKDASMQMGDRLLYLHMPYFRGRDVGNLQAALSSMGFSCVLDNSFGPETEQALRDFQMNMGLSITGILDEQSVSSILRLRHVWEGKRGFIFEGRIPDFARSTEVLENIPLCVFGTDEATRVLANRVSNLARATTAQSRFVSAQALAASPSHDMLLVELRYETDPLSARGKVSVDNEMPRVYLKGEQKNAVSLGKAIAQAYDTHRRVTIVLKHKDSDEEHSSLHCQENAVLLLNYVCAALESFLHKPNC